MLQKILDYGYTNQGAIVAIQFVTLEQNLYKITHLELAYYHSKHIQEQKLVPIQDQQSANTK
jgi:hypothetical protein